MTRSNNGAGINSSLKYKAHKPGNLGTGKAPS